MNSVIINSFEEYINHMENYKNKFLFRGQANSTWDIIPSLFRNIDLFENEISIINENKYFDSNNILSSLFKMQHYGTATRLLDLTISPYSALFFAIDDEAQLANDGVVYIIDKAQNISCREKDLELFCNLLLDETINHKQLSEEEMGCLCKNYIVQYDYNFSYTNNRAILQGGTALIAGFTVENNKICRKNKINLESLAIERIIIPSNLKSIFLTKLNVLGYSKSILYEAFESSHKNEYLEFCEIKFDVTPKAYFNKIVATHKVNSIDFNRDCLALEIEKLHNKLLNTYGESSRVWLYFCIDENDIEHGNWICRVAWSDNNNFEMIWTKNYFMQRLKYINEEVSKQEVIDRYKPLIYQALGIEEIIKNAYLTKNLENIVKTLYANVDSMNACWTAASDVPFGNITIEPFSRAALNYICEVDRLIRDTILFVERKETEKFIFYWIDSVLKDCEKSKEKLATYNKYYI